MSTALTKFRQATRSSLLVAAGLLAACSSSSNGTTCQSDAECSSGQTCVGGSCTTVTPTDAGATDAGPADAGAPVDAGAVLDAGATDAGAVADAGAPDAGESADAGAVDAGEPADAGTADAGEAADAGAADAGDGGMTPSVLAPAGDTAQQGPVDGISCSTSEQLLFHIHAHVSIYVGTEARLIPAGIGIGVPRVYDSAGNVVNGACFSWIHTHDESGVIHMEAPQQFNFTLGNLFDIWGQPLSSTQVGPETGPVTVFVNGLAYLGDPTTIPLDAHNVVQLDVGTPVVPAQPYTFSPGL